MMVGCRFVIFWVFRKEKKKGVKGLLVLKEKNDERRNELKKSEKDGAWVYLTI